MVFRTDMDIVCVFKYFVEKIYHSLVSYNRAYGKSTKMELSDIKTRQFLIVFCVIGFSIGFMCFCLANFVINRSLKTPQVFAVEMALAVFLSLLVVRKLNRLGMYEEAVEKVEKMEMAQRAKYYWWSFFIGSFRVLSFLAVIYGTRWLLITFF